MNLLKIILNKFHVLTIKTEYQKHTKEYEKSEDDHKISFSCKMSKM